MQVQIRQLGGSSPVYCLGNLKKYQTMNNGYRNETTDSASGGIRINNKEIKTAETLKLLGVTKIPD